MKRSAMPPGEWSVPMLAAAEEIRQVKARYFRFVDTRRWDCLRELFTTDATLHFPERTAALEDCDTCISRFSSILAADVTSIHEGGMAEIGFFDETSAHAVSFMRDTIIFPEGRSNPFGVARLAGAGHYHETYQRCADGWRIASLRLERLFVETVPQGTDR
ncbi:nuclear transport factor 2 family protein [Pacificimonas sp. ICDLI1SI03]